jgi:methionyl aminopeptidase
MTLQTLYTADYQQASMEASSLSASKNRHSDHGPIAVEIGRAIQLYAEAQRCSVVCDFCGHGLGRNFHDAPNIVHYGRPGRGAKLVPGMFFTIEPMINLGKYDVKLLDDGWTAVTRDRSLSAQFEHSIGITETGCEIFTLSPGGLHHPPYA